MRRRNAKKLKREEQKEEKKKKKAKKKGGRRTMRIKWKYQCVGQENVTEEEKERTRRYLRVARYQEGGG